MIDQLLNYLIRYIPTSFLVGSLVLFGIGTVLFMIFLGDKKGARWSLGLLMVEYMVMLLVLAVFARGALSTRPFNLTPFWSYRAVFQDGKNGLLIQNIANVMAFIPIGFLLCRTFGRMRWWTVISVGAGFSLLIEVLQFVFRRGFAEFDDVFHNVLGCAIGYCAYVAFDLLLDLVNKVKNE